MVTRIIRLEKEEKGIRASIAGIRVQPLVRPTAEQAAGAIVLANRDLFGVRIWKSDEPQQGYDDHEIELGFEALVNRVEQELRARARKILQENSDLTEFVKGMGLATFTDANDYNLDVECEPRFKPVADLLGKWDDFLRLTGIPVRFTATSPEVLEWGIPK